MSKTQRKTRRRTKIKMVLESPAGETHEVSMPIGVAWAAARGIIRHSHYSVVLYGEYGIARFDLFGNGSVEWNEKSTMSGKFTPFDHRTVVSI